METKEAPALLEFEESVWQWLTAPVGGQPDTLQEMMTALEQSPEFRSAAFLRSIDRLRDSLDQLPTHTPLDAPQEVLAGDLLVVVRALLTRLR